MPADGGWQKYVVADARTISRVSRRVDVPLTGHLSVLGMTGMTACFGLADVCRLQPAETLVVSAAEGAVGSVVGQIAKIKGCRVVGIAGALERRRAAAAGSTDFGRILMRRLTVPGFIVVDYLPRAREALENLGAWVAEGHIRWKDHVVDGLKLGRLFRGDHHGKLIVRLSEEDADGRPQPEYVL